MKAVAEDLFETLGKEEEQEKRALHVEPSPGLDSLIEHFKSIHDDIAENFMNTKWPYENFIIHGPKEFTSRDVSSFSIFLQGDSNASGWEAAHYLDAVILICPEKHITIYSGTFPHALKFVNMHDKERVTVIGDCESVAEDAAKGEFHLYGNTRATGIKMGGGRVCVHGDGGQLGTDMSGGQIHVDGAYWPKAVALFACGGEIYNKGKLIWKDHKRYD